MRAVAAPASALVTKLHGFLWTARLYLPQKPCYFLAGRSVELGVFSHAHKMLEQKRRYNFTDKNQNGPGNPRTVVSVWPRPTYPIAGLQLTLCLSGGLPGPLWGGPPARPASPRHPGAAVLTPGQRAGSFT